MNEVETLMSVEDLGHDLSSVKFLLKKHQGVETDIELHETQLQTLCDQAQALIDSGHFDAGRIEQGTENILQRYLYKLKTVFVCWYIGHAFLIKKNSLFWSRTENCQRGFQI